MERFGSCFVGVSFLDSRLDVSCFGVCIEGNAEAPWQGSLEQARAGIEAAIPTHHKPVV